MTIDGFAPSDQMAFRLTRDQGLFVMYEHTHLSALHFIAQNLSQGSIVLEYPTLEQFEAEVKKGYEYVGISFKICNIEQLYDMCDLVRRISPSSKIIIGGYGTICTSILQEDPAWTDKYDFVCDLEGVSYMRRLLGEPETSEMRCQLPKIGSTLSWLNPQSIGTIGIVLSGLGCTFKCPFCNTSAYTKGKYIEVMTARQIYQAMRGYWENTAFTNSITIYDENFIDHRDKVSELGKLIQEDKKYGLKKYNYFAFGSLSALTKYEPEELLLNGIDTLWVGVESKYSPLPKTKGTTAKDQFDLLHSIGIKTVGSWIIGEDFQTPENIEDDMALFIMLDSTFQQLSILTVSPTLGLWKSLNHKGRIPHDIQWRDYHLYGKTYVPKNFTHQELLDQLHLMYQRIYQQNGPAMMKVLEVNLNGYKTCIQSKHPLLAKEKSQFFKDRCNSYHPLLKTALTFSPSEKVTTRLKTLDKQYKEIFGAKTEFQIKIEDQILNRAEKEMKRRDKEPIKQNLEPFRRYTYPILDQRTGRRPFEVEYPDMSLKSRQKRK